MNLIRLIALIIGLTVLAECQGTHEKINKPETFHSKSESKIITNFNTKIPNLTITIMPTESLKLYGLIHRKCSALYSDASFEQFDFEWRNGNNFIVSTNEMLQIPINDLSVLGEYRCICKSRISDNIYEASTNVSVDNNSNPNTESYQIAIIPHPTIFTFGESFSLRCVVTPEIDNLIYQWSKNDKFVSYGKVLSFKSFGKDDTGVYTCKVVGVSKNLQPIELEAKTYQKICNFNHQNIELIPGNGNQIIIKPQQLKELHCEINVRSGFNGSNATWTFNNKQINEDSFEELGLSRLDRKWSSILVIEEASHKNEGQYSCEVGNINKTVNVVILPEPGFVYVHPEKVEVSEGEPVEFHCRIDGIPNLKNKKLQWNFIPKNGTKIPISNNKRWKTSNPCETPQTSFINSDKVKKEDEGIYECVTPEGKRAQGELIVGNNDKSKENERINVVVTPPNLNIREGQNFEFQCYSSDNNGNPAGKPDIKFTNGSHITSDQRFVVSPLEQSRIRVSVPNGLKLSENDLQLICFVNDSEKLMNITIQKECPPNQRLCKNGVCLDSNKFCDGKSDCADGSDEDIEQCDKCDPIEKPCGTLRDTNGTNVQYFSIFNTCDGENDCKNGFDEKNCPKPNESCNTQVFTCKDKTQIPYSYVCDAEPDCPEGEDQLNCMKPVFINTNNTSIRAHPGSTVTMSCEFLGHPLPNIVWRYNWNCLRDTPRITVKQTINDCQSVVSTLTIRDFQSGDDAIYGCEAYYHETRVFGTDYFVSMG